VFARPVLAAAHAANLEPERIHTMLKAVKDRLRRGGAPALAAAGVAGAAGAVVVALAVALSGGAPPAVAYAQPAAQSAGDVAQTIAVVGEGEASGAPDVAYVNVAVQNEAQTARQAIDQNSSAMTAVIDALKRLGIPEQSLRTSGISITPVRARPRPDDPQPPPVTGYQATNTLTVTVEQVSRTGEVIDAAVGAGANVAGGVRFRIKNDDALRQSALDAAVKAARASADAMAAAAGLRVTGVRSMSDESGGDGPIPLARMAAADAASTAPPVQPGELTVTARVRVVYTFG
jgi:uncharacterized protein YggE